MPARRSLAFVALSIAALLFTMGCSTTQATVGGTTGSTAAQTAPAEGAQRIRVTAQGQFTPESTAKSGTPIALEFGPGGGCTAAIQFRDLGVFEDLTDGGGVVNLPALSPGEYPLVCQSDMVMGTLIVE